MVVTYAFDKSIRPRLLLAYADPVYASMCGRHFRRLGWEVELVSSGSEARDLALSHRPDVVALEVALLDESGWLTSAKISTENPDMRIVLIVPDHEAPVSDRLEMIGASQSVCRAGGPDALAQAVLGAASLSAAV